MTVHVAINGRSREVSIDRLERGYRVTVDGRSRLVDAEAAGTGAWSLVFLDEPATSHEVVLAPASQTGDVHVSVDGAMFAASVDGAASRRPRSAAAGPAGGPDRVTAPMPGKVVKVLVRPGDRVTARQGVVVVEAMKMENELRAPRAGVVKEIAAAEGASVESGAVLVVIE